ncbi:ATP-dependent RNA helicase DDX19A-like [Chiloscyllium plagiosum]|uniref:ATP-dependent RNA helicase DDX19A-like n=1 Tax=Chiloscyllium plagiosum TaxID=36176 RepID=UPI001CB7D69E|nr:ATP-dependent RNA helicase DDX19A-like [Chiloscyllium plagiosum]
MPFNDNYHCYRMTLEYQQMSEQNNFRIKSGAITHAPATSPVAIAAAATDDDITSAPTDLAASTIAAQTTASTIAMKTIADRFVTSAAMGITLSLCSPQPLPPPHFDPLPGAITIAQAMIFCHTRKTAGWLAAELSKEGHQVALLSGEMMAEQRAAVIQRFLDGKEKVLVTTNVCARGIYVEQVSVVINFDLPVDKDGNPDCETYLHRIGRTGRFGKRGLAINMMDSKYSMNILNRS